MSTNLTPILAVGFIPPQAALLLTVCLVVFLFRRDMKQRPDITGAVWIPLTWMLIICSRQASEWLDLFGFRLGGASLEEGSPFDASIYFSVIAAGIYVLHRRRIRLGEIIRNNQWLAIFFIYCFLAIFWSDFPFVSFKRWIKVIGHPVMVLVILTEPDPIAALIALMKRCAFIVVPISITFIRYYPQWGRVFDMWNGAPVDTGITTNKNALGCDCLILGFFFFWYLLQVRQMERGPARRNELIFTSGFLIAIWYLLSKAQSSTSSVSLLIAIGVVWVVGLKSINKKLIGTYAIVAVVIVAVAQGVFGIYDHVLHFLHKNPTLTDRTLLWKELLKVEINPLLGTGFEGFWLGARREALWAKHWWQPNEAHNGYLETYLNLGLIGLSVLVGLLIATYRKARTDLLRNFELGRFRLGFLFAVIAFNWTEAAFKNISPVWFAFYLIALDYPAPAAETEELSEFEEPYIGQPELEPVHEST